MRDGLQNGHASDHFHKSSAVAAATSDGTSTNLDSKHTVLSPASTDPFLYGICTALPRQHLMWLNLNFWWMQEIVARIDVLV